MLRCEIKPGKPRIAVGGGNPEDIIASIELSGPFRGTAVGIFPPDTALAIVNKMAGTNIKEVDKMVKDGVGEVINMVAGTAKKNLANDDITHVDLSLPTVVKGNEYAFVSSVSKWLELTFTSTLGSFIIRVIFTADYQ